MKSQEMSHKQILKNSIYIFIYAFKISPVFFLSYIIINSLVQTADNLLIILLYRYMLNGIVANYGFERILRVIILCGGGIGGLNIIINAILTQVNEMKIISVSGVIQRDLYKKASELELLMYDDTEFFTEYIRAAQRGQEQIGKSIQLTVKLAASIFGLLGIAGVIMTVDPIVGLFPIVACIINTVTQLMLNNIRYKRNRELDIITRKKEYCKRIFYQPEYAKEIRMTGIVEPHFKMLYSAIEEEKAIVKKYGLKERTMSLINLVCCWAIMVYYLPMFYMIYAAMILKRIGIGNLAVLNESNASMFNTLNEITLNYVQLQEMGMYGEYLRKFLQYESVGKELGVTLETEELLPKEITIKDLCFGYDKKRVLNGISMKIKPGEKIAIVGYNGAGKTTFTKLLLGLYQPESGSISYGDSESSEYGYEDYIKLFGVLVQQYQIYACTLAENIKMNSVSEEELPEIRRVLQMVGLSKYAEEWKNSLNTRLTREFDDDGMLVSGGEAQRIAIARILYQKHPIVVMDEPSSALDPLAEQQLNQQIFKELHDSTVIVISHRLSTTMYADKIYFFENGRIIEEGTHKELMELGGQYAKMYTKQCTSYVRSEGKDE